MYEAGILPAKYFAPFRDENDKELGAVCARYVYGMLCACVVYYTSLTKWIWEKFQWKDSAWNKPYLQKIPIVFGKNVVAHHHKQLFLR